MYAFCVLLNLIQNCQGLQLGVHYLGVLACAMLCALVYMIVYRLLWRST